MSQTVLIVDDHAGFRAFTRRLLEAGGYTVVGQAEDGASALAAVAELRPELVLLDVLPDSDGFAVAERLAEDGGEPVVVLTSSREAADFGQRLDRTPAPGLIHKDELSGPPWPGSWRRRGEPSRLSQKMRQARLSSASLAVAMSGVSAGQDSGG